MFVDLPDGRRLEVVVAGTDSGMPLVFHYGTPSAAVPFAPMVEAVAQRGLRAVVCSRPGYGDSTEHPGRRVADAAADTAAVLDHLGAGEFVTIGWSGGGPHALACLALLPGRCLAATSIAGVAPYGVPDLDWTAGMGADNIEEFGATMAGVEALTAYLEAQAPALAAVTGEQVADVLRTLIPEVDRRQLTGEFADFVASTFRRAVVNGIAGWRDDDLAFVSDWGFPLADCRPAAIWQGEQDLMVPFPHARWLAAHVPEVQAHLLPEDGHLSLLVGSFDKILDDLLALAGRVG